MRKLVITRGPQGAGKSTTLRQLGLGPYTLSPDAIRRTLSGPVMTPRGTLTTSQEHEPRVWGMVHRILSERMARGELLAIDATHRSRGDFKMYRKLARRHRYQLACLDFSTIPLAQALDQNRRRPAHEVVPEGVLRRTHESCRQGQVPDDLHHVTWAPDGSHTDALSAWLHEPLLSGDDYAYVCIIGDLQGCWAPLRAFFAERPFREDVLYLFVGDLCDRGLENGVLLQQLLPLSAAPNVRIHWGNHEDFLNSWSLGEPVTKAEFSERTVPQLLAADISPAAVGDLCARMVDFTGYTRGGVRVFVSHAGLATVPDFPEGIATRQYALGTGHYNDPVDDRFSRLAPEGWVQAHGHRNPTLLPVHAAPRSYNLEGHVEHGGDLRILIHDDDGIRAIEIPNPLYKSLPMRIREDSLRSDERAILPHWVTDDMPERPTIPAETLAAMREHALIGEKVSAVRPWISSFNFTRDAFHQREWDALNVTARGLFVNNRTSEIIARSYDKFFNLGERPETQPPSLKASLAWPVTVYQKDNGYLGILGYDAEEDALRFCSKSTPDSDFAGWFEEIFTATVPAGKQQLLKRFLRDAQATMAFEVLDPARDPHIIDYDSASVVLLDVIRRAQAFERVRYDTLQRIGRRFELPVKERLTALPSWPALQGWLRHVQAPGYHLNGQWLEGFVLEDDDGFLFKIKLDYYNFWKSMRTLKDRILSTRKSGQPLRRDVSAPRVAAFYQWASTLPDALLRQDIATLRAQFLAGEEMPEWTPPPDTPSPSSAAIGYTRALDNLARLDEIKPKTADGLLRAALEGDDKMAVLRSHPIRDRLVLSATPGEDRQAAAEAANMDIDAPDPGDEQTGAER
jgi:predicted kinase